MDGDGDDQSVHNYLYYTNNFNEAIPIPHRPGPKYYNLFNTIPIMWMMVFCHLYLLGKFFRHVGGWIPLIDTCIISNTEEFVPTRY